jgi:hypothetical protein
MTESQPSAATTELQQNPAAQVVPFFDEPTNTFSYIVQDPQGASCAVIDCVMKPTCTRITSLQRPIFVSSWGAGSASALQ